MQVLVLNHLKVLLSKAMVLNVKEKAVRKLSDKSYRDERKRTIEDAPKCSDVIKTKEGRQPWDKSGGNLLTGQTVTGVKMA